MRNLVLFLFLFLIIEGKTQVVINEYSCSNIKRSIVYTDTVWYYDDDFYNEDSETLDSVPYIEPIAVDDTTCLTCRDNFMKLEDWIELYNPGNEPVDISGFFITDNEKKMKKYLIPSCTAIPAKGFKVIFASGRNLIENDTIHTNFKLTQTNDKKETLFLSDKGGNLIDKIEIKKTKGCNSYGRMNDGTESWGIFSNPTPGKSNNTKISYKNYASKPKFNIDAGFYKSNITVSITGTDSNKETIYYTIDGSEPNKNSLIYSTPVSINKTTVLKAIIIENDSAVLPGFIQYRTYFINDKHSLPVVSISGGLLDSLALGLKPARPWGTLEYFDVNGVRTADSYGEFNSHGQDSWIIDQRSLDFIARDEMGYSKELKEKFFPLSDRKEFQRIILRAAGDDNYPATSDSIQNEANMGSAHLRDAFFQNLCKEGGLKLDVRTASKCIVYLNGEYWGVYDIRENPDDHDYTEYYYSQGKYDIQYILKWWDTWAEYGGDKALSDWRELHNYIMRNDMSKQENFDKVAEQLDVQSLADYVISHSISVSSDWLIYNTGLWRGLNPDGGHKKWGYILWDNDASFAFYINYTEIPDTSASAAFCNVESLVDSISDTDGHIKMLNKLRTNEQFNNFYISRYIDLINTTFSCDNMLHQLDSLKELIAPEMYRHIERWPGGSYEEWEKNYFRLRNFITRRCGAWANNKMDSCYNLTGPYHVTFDALPRENIAMEVNSLKVENLPWNASYFGGIDIAINASDYSTIDKPFNKWKSNEGIFSYNETNADNYVRVKNDDKIVALFQEETGIKDTKSEIGQLLIYPTIVTNNVNIRFSLNSQSDISITLYTIEGVKTDDIYSGTFNEGSHELQFSLGKKTTNSGVYLICFVSNNYTKYEKIIITH